MKNIKEEGDIMNGDSKLIERILNAINTPCKFYETLESIEDDDRLIVLCKSIKNKKEIDYFDIAYNAMSQGGNHFRVSNILRKIAFLSLFDIQSIFRFYDYLNFGVPKNSIGTMQYDITKNLCKNDKNTAEILLDNLIKIDKEYSIFHISDIFSTLHNHHKENQYFRIIKYFDNSLNENVTLACIDSISKINLNSKQQREVLKIFQKILDKNIENQIIFIIRSCSRMIDKNIDFSNILLDISRFKNKNIKYELSRILTFYEDELILERWWKDIFFSFADTESDDFGILSNLNLLFLNILKGTNSYELIKDFFIKWSINVELDGYLIENRLDYFQNKFYSEFSELHNKFITEFFLMEDPVFHHIAYCMTEGGSKFDKETIDLCNDADLIYIIRITLGYHVDFYKLSNLLWSISYKENLADPVRDKILYIFLEYIAMDYPHETLEFFKKLEISDLDKNQIFIINEAIEHVSKILDFYQKLPILKELKPPLKESREIMRIKQEQINNASKDAMKNSILYSIFTKVPIKYGKGMFSNFNGKYSDITYFDEFSSSFSLPKSEIYCPVFSAIYRYNFKNIKRNKK